MVAHQKLRKNGIIKPAYKNEEREDNLDNYKVFTLTAGLGKLFTSILNCRLKLDLLQICKLVVGNVSLQLII